MRVQKWWVVALTLTCVWFGGLAVILALRVETAERKLAVEKREVGQSRNALVKGKVFVRDTASRDTSLWEKFGALPSPYTLLITMGASTSLIWMACYISS